MRAESTKQSPEVSWQLGKEAARSGLVETALNHYRSVFSNQLWLSRHLEFVDDVLALGNAGRDELKHQRNVYENAIVSGASASHIFAVWKHLNRVLHHDGRDRRLYAALEESHGVVYSPKVRLLLEILQQIRSSGHHTEAAPYIAYLEEVLDVLDTADVGVRQELLIFWFVPHICADAIEISINMDQLQTATRICQHLLALAPDSSIYFLMEEVSESHGDVLQPTLEAAFSEMDARGQAEILVARILNKHDPEGFIEMGAPLDEHTVEARRIVDSLSSASTPESIRVSVDTVWGQMFGPSIPRDFSALANDIYTGVRHLLPKLGDAHI